MYLFFIILSIVCSVSAHEFMHTPKARRISLNKIKEQSADAFSEQVRLAAEAVQSIGALQVLYYAQASTENLGPEIEQLRAIGVRIHQCRVQYADLFAPICPSLNPFNQKDLSPIGLFGHLMQALGAVQQYAIAYLKEIFEDAGCIFIRQHANRLPDVVKTVTLYTQDFKVLVDTLCGLQKKMRAARKPDALVVSGKDSPVSAEKA